MSFSWVSLFTNAPRSAGLAGEYTHTSGVAGLCGKSLSLVMVTLPPRCEVWAGVVLPSPNVSLRMNIAVPPRVSEHGTKPAHTAYPAWLAANFNVAMCFDLKLCSCTKSMSTHVREADSSMCLRRPGVFRPLGLSPRREMWPVAWPSPGNPRVESKLNLHLWPQ